MKLLLLVSSLLGMILLFTSCGSDDPAPAAAGTTFSGTISSSSSSTGLEPLLNPIEDQGNYGAKTLSSSVAGKTIRCRRSDTQASTTGTISSTGAFSVSITAGVPTKCVIAESATSTTVNASFVISSSTSKSMNGTSKVKGEFVPATTVSAGTVTYDPYTAKATMTDTALGSSISTSAVTDPWDYTGTYLASSYTGTTPPGYTATLCTQAQQQQQGSNCDGPTDGETFYVKKISGFEVDGNGATTSTAKYGIMVWRSSAAFAACGSKLGFTYAEGKTNALIDLTNSDVSEGTPVWTTSINPTSAILGWDGSSTVIPAGAATVSEGWKISTAKAAYTMQDCETTTVGTGTSALPGWKCYDGASKYSISLGGGCVDSAGASVNVTDWSGLTCTSEAFTITGSELSFTKYTCSGLFSGTQVTCTNTNYNEAGYNWNTVGNIVTAGSLCSSINTSTDKGALAQLRCYADAYWKYMQTLQSDTTLANSTCFRDLRTDWSASTAANFILSTGPAKAFTEYVLEGFDYTSNNSGSFRNEEQDVRGIQVVSGSSTIWINCRTLRIFTMTLTKETTSTLLAEMVSETRLTDTKASCWTSAARAQLGGVDTEGKSVSKTLFTMTKQ